MNTSEEISQRKQALRHELKRRRQALTAEQQSSAGDQLAANALSLTHQGMRIGIYHALPNEAPTQALARALWKKGCELYLPHIQNSRVLQFWLWERDAALATDKLGILTPTETHIKLAAANLDAAFIPLLGFDQSGRRLGMGGGYYDTTLSNAPKTTKIGLAFDRQEVECIPVEEHDIRLDIVVTESRILRFGNLYSE